MKHRDFVILVRGAEEINALVIFSRLNHIPATQTVPASDTEELTVIYTDPVVGASWPSKDRILQSLHVEIGVPPASAGKFMGWKGVGPDSPPPPPPADPLQKSSGVDGDAGDWTQTAGEGLTDDTTEKPSLPSAADLDAVAAEQTLAAAKQEPTGPDGKTDAERGYGWGSDEHKEAMLGEKPIDPAAPATTESISSDPTAGVDVPAESQAAAA